MIGDVCECVCAFVPLYSRTLTWPAAQNGTLHCSALMRSAHSIGALSLSCGLFDFTSPLLFVHTHTQQPSHIWLWPGHFFLSPGKSPDTNCNSLLVGRANLNRRERDRIGAGGGAAALLIIIIGVNRLDSTQTLYSSLTHS